MVGSIDDISWHIHDDLDAVKHVDRSGGDCNFVDMKDEHWNAIAIPIQYPQCHMEEHAHILVDVGRFDSFKRVLRLKLPCTVRDVIKGIRDIYQAPITEAEVKEHRDDSWGYKETALERLSRGEIVKAHEMNGDRAYFEGLRQAYGCQATIFEVLLGS
jgi:hypothetical protein